MFEYTTKEYETKDFDLPSLDRWLDRVGEEGWELVNVISKPSADDCSVFESHFYIFKRQLK